MVTITQLNNNNNVRTNQMAIVPYLPNSKKTNVNQSIRIKKDPLQHEQVEQVLKKRKCMKKQKIFYVFPSSNNNNKTPIQAYIIKWDPERPTKSGVYKKLDYKNRPAFWMIRLKGATVRVDLRPELYGKMNRVDGWTFVDEDKTMRKCLKSKSPKVK